MMMMMIKAKTTSKLTILSAQNIIHEIFSMTSLEKHRSNAFQAYPSPFIATGVRYWNAVKP